MTNQEQIAQAIIHQGLLPLYYNKDEQVCLEILQVLYEAGIRVVEYTNRGEAAFGNFKAMRKLTDAAMPGMYLGIGTIKSAEQARAFIDAGADFLISPVFDAGVCDVAYLHKIKWVPGCMTPSEIHEAEKAGCSLVKLFPGNILGPGFVSAIRELFPNVSFMPTGGVELQSDNLKAWFASGVVAVGMGSKLITQKIMESRDLVTLKKNTGEALQLIQAIKVKPGI